MSFLRRLWQRVRHPTGFVGYDLEGNAYYERHFGADRRSKRMVQYREGEDMWSYVGGSRRLPIQWTAWLAHTRLNPPTLQELQRDLLRQQRVLHSAKLLEAEDQKQREIEMQQRQALQAPVTSDEPLPPPGSAEKADAAVPSLAQYHTADIPNPSATTSASQPTPQTTAKSSSASKDAKPLPTVAGKDEYQPESWTPTARLRVKRGQ